MILNFDQTLKELNGETIKDEKGEVKLKTFCQNAILAPEKEQNAEEKVRAYQLAIKIQEGGEVEVTAEEIALIKKKVGEAYAPIVVGQIFEILESLK